MNFDQSQTDRRTVLGALGSGAMLALAGCSGNGDQDGETGGDGTTEPDETTDTEDTTDSEETDDTGGQEEVDELAEPTEFPEGEECAVCNMIAADHPEWNSQLVHEDETRTYFCSSGCMSAYYADPQEFDGPDTAIENVWVTGYKSGDLHNAEEVHFVRVQDSSHVDDIMMMNPTPFAERADAEAFVGEFDVYSEEDIIGLEDFDMDLAMQYRGKFFEEENEMQALAEPAEFPEGEECAVCNMIAADHPEWNSQLVHEDETRTYFCSSGCMSAYYADPQEFDGPDTAIENVWVTGYKSGDLHNAEEVHFVRVQDSSHVDDIMMMNPTPFAERADAEAFVGEFDVYSEEDIIGLEDFDMDLAMQYRGKFFEEG